MADIVTKEKRSAMMAGIKGKNTRPEIAIIAIIWECGVKGKRKRLLSDVADLTIAALHNNATNFTEITGYQDLMSRLSQYFTGIAAKRLSAVETDPETSRQGDLPCLVQNHLVKTGGDRFYQRQTKSTTNTFLHWNRVSAEIKRMK